MLAFKTDVETTDIRLEFQPRSDGGLRVFSPDEPGLILGGPDPERTRRVIPEALRSLLEHNRGIKVHEIEMRGDVVHVAFSRAA